MKYLILAIVLSLFLSNVSYADEFIIPFSCYPKQIQEFFAQRGKKLDIVANDRTRDSYGFLVNKGSEFIIYTYHPTTDKDFNLMMDVMKQNITGDSDE